MATTTGTCNVFDAVKNWLGTNAINPSSDSFGILLLSSTQEPNVSTDQYVSDVSANEISGNGYARQILTNVAWAASGGANGQMMLDADNPVWTASGGDIVCRWWVLYDNTPSTDAARNLIAYGLLDNTPADVTTTDGNTLTLNINSLGFFTVG